MRSHKPILLVEGDKVDAMTVKRALRDIQVTNQLTVAGNGEEALDLLHSDHHEDPCIILLDLNMPKVSGIDVLKVLRAKKPHIPVVIITANSEIETAVECLKLGAHDYLVKPIDLKTFSSALRNALEIGLLRNEVLSLKGIHFDRLPKTNKAFE